MDDDAALEELKDMNDWYSLDDAALKERKEMSPVISTQAYQVQSGPSLVIVCRKIKNLTSKVIVTLLNGALLLVQKSYTNE